MTSPFTRVTRRIRRTVVHGRNNRAIRRLALQVAQNAPPPGPSQNGAPKPVLFFNASTRLEGLSLNAAFSILTAWSLRLQGAPVIHFACRSAMHPCVLGTRADDPSALPPCRECIAQSEVLYTGADVRWFQMGKFPTLEHDLSILDLDRLFRYEYGGAPLGQLVLPSVRWILRRHHLNNDVATRTLVSRYIAAAAAIAQQFGALIDEAQPQAVVVFNGMFFPEATARWVASQRGIPVVAHEVGLQPNSGFFTLGEATAYPLDIPDDFQLTPEQDARLDAYLEQRFQGNFSMAGIQFWPAMQSLGAEFWQRAAAFRQVVPVFTNVVFDTSQGHANVVFPHMFAWLDSVLELIRAHPDTFFIIRAHPDEIRPTKESRESVRQWVERRQVAGLPNACFIDAGEHASSYELIQHAKFVLIYNSTIGLEASVLGVPVLCGGKARFTQIPTVHFPRSPEEFSRLAEGFLAAGRVEFLPEHRINARRFLYVQLFRSSLPFGDFLREDGVWRGYVELKPFDWQALLPDRSATLRTVTGGILHGQSFLFEK